MVLFWTGFFIGLIVACFFFYLLKSSHFFLKNERKISNKLMKQANIIEGRFSEQQRENSRLTVKLENQENRLIVLSEKLAEEKTKNSEMMEKLVFQKKEMEKIQQAAYFQFERIANRILEEKTEKFTQSNTANLFAILRPLGENIDIFKKKVEETYDKESKERFSLGEKIKDLMQQTNRVSMEANNLANALKCQVKKQGNWGEMILENILQQSGMRKNQEYVLQKTIENEEGKFLRPDVLVKLPDNRVIIIDSKVSLVAYDRFASANTESDQALHLKEHIRSIRVHIDELSAKKYDTLDNSLDFTMMFIPIEPAYLVAIQQEDMLWSEAYAKRILLISPTNLIACLKIINDLWKIEMQNKNVIKIAKQGSSLYDKLVCFVETFEKIGKQLEQTQDCFLKAKNQLNNGKGNLISQALKIKKLGLNPRKKIPYTMLPTYEEE